jgi:glycosyltransferase involved in cell wall biosynthesis
MKISVITPCFNEEDSIEFCVAAVRDLFRDQLKDFDYEHIVCDNASTDSTREILMNIASADRNLKVVINSRNVGPFRNMWVGLKLASGDAIIPFLPADLQDPPDVIPKFIEKWQQGNLVVYGVRQNRKEFFLMRFFRSSYYKVIARFADFRIPLDAGEFLLADHRVIKSVLEVDDEYPYIRGLIAQTGVRSAVVPYDWGVRQKGKSKLNFTQLIDQALNGFVSTSRIPARIILLTGLVVSLLGVLGAILTAAIVLFGDNEVLPGIPTIIVSLFFFGGIQIFFLGLIGEYVLSIHGQVRKAPKAFIEEKYNLD